MDAVITAITDYAQTLPIWVWPAAAGLLAAIILTAVFGARRARLYRSAVGRFRDGITDTELTGRLLARPNLVERLIRNEGEDVVAHFGMADHLLHRLEHRGRAEDASRILKLAPETGLFPVFMLALEKRSVASVFRAWLTGNRNILLLRTMAFAARGRDFDGRRAAGLLREAFSEIRELSGDPEWPVRFFVLRLLLTDDDAHSGRLIRDTFSDPHPLLRRTVASEAKYDGDWLPGCLMTMVLDDPVPEVRRAARDRIEADFPETWTLDPSTLTTLQMVHILDLLKDDSREDENIAVNALQSDSEEARLSAARYLERSGGLERMFNGADLGDRENWERRLDLLGRAVIAGVSGFLDMVKYSDTIDSLLLGAQLLPEGGDEDIIPALARKVFSRKDIVRNPAGAELYRSTVSLICVRGDDMARRMLVSEMNDRRNDATVLGYILPLLPVDDAGLFRNTLVDFLADPRFPDDDLLVEALGRMPSRIFLGPVLDILKADRSAHDHAVRLRALRCLGAWGLERTFQTILENLTVLPVELTREFSVLLEDMKPKVLKERARYILDSPDARIRAALISCLPAGQLETFRKDIKDGLNDADPDVRIACLRALMDDSGTKAMAPALSLLRDPVDRVRMDAARIAGLKATGRLIAALNDLLDDPEEVATVRAAAIAGLAASPVPESVDILVRHLDTEGCLEQETLEALAAKTDRKSLQVLVEQFKDAEAVLRDRITDAFVKMGEEGEDAMTGLLREDIASLKPFLADILTRTGFVEKLIRRLGHRSPEVRRDAAELLASIATPSAYRGIVLAAKDPDQDVRIRVTRALESLATKKGAEILSGLEQDPDRKVRKYTRWAMERLRAKELP